ncbi:hypothetical protein COLO4_11816 [Corchorus olitorius]|uniref:Uncharacterized protein n=1 Tax=Corchorus olitorius TaxID=93759 RepID=A0A1R3K353_9ROSI|nr:hypothetical protein COLO4_11816 [Corchorus olitorius]
MRVPVKEKGQDRVRAWERGYVSVRMKSVCNCAVCRGKGSGVVERVGVKVLQWRVVDLVCEEGRDCFCEVSVLAERRERPCIFCV